MKNSIKTEKKSKLVSAVSSFFPFLRKSKKNRRNESGFSLIETTSSMVVFLIASLGVYNTIIYSVNYNAGNNSRSQALVVLQQEVELLRSAKFTPEVIESNLTGGTKAPYFVTSADDSRYIVETVIDDDPFTSGVQIDSTKPLKELTVTVTLARPTPGWQTSVPTTVIVRRVRAN